MFQRQIRRIERQRGGQRNDVGLVGQGHDLHNQCLVALTLDPLIELELEAGGNDQRLGLGQKRGKTFRENTIRQPLDPAAGIDQHLHQ